MKLLIFLFLLAVFLPLGAQLRTPYRPLPSAVRAWQWRIDGPRRVLQISYVRMG